MECPQCGTVFDSKVHKFKPKDGIEPKIYDDGLDTDAEEAAKEADKASSKKKPAKKKAKKKGAEKW